MSEELNIVKVIPCLDMKDGRVVKGINFVDFADAGDPAEQAEYYSNAGADEVAFLDIAASVENRQTMEDVVRRTAARSRVPFCVGGGIRSLADIERIIKAGASKVSINTAAVKNPELIDEAVEKFGKTAIIIAIDAKLDPDGSYKVYINGGLERTDIDAGEWAAEVAKRGAGCILVTSVDADGTKDGYDIDLTRLVAEKSGVEVIASGGAGKLEDFVKAVKEGKATAVLAASLFHFRQLEIAEVKKHLNANGIPVSAV